jgi:hypothetical protein
VRGMRYGLPIFLQDFAMKKGIVTSVNKITDISTGKVLGGQQLSAQDLSYYALYWDAIAIPTNNIVHVSVPNEDDWLSAGVLFRPQAQHQGSIYISQMSVSNGEIQVPEDSEIYTFLKNSVAEVTATFIESDKEIDWVAHQFGGDELILQEDPAFTKRNVIRLKLLNLLPVPIGSVSAHEILDFKYRRKDELQNLHRAIDEMYVEITKSSDIDFSSSRKVDDFQNKIKDLHKVSDEQWKTTSKYSLSLDMSVKNTLIGLAMGWQSPILPSVSAIAGAVICSMKLTKTLDIANQKEKHILAYLSHAKKEGVI